jgi:acyl-coenzyme A synthetase/AMP-(fatty) acid ligase
MKQRPGIGPEDVLLAVTTLSFDIAALELLLPLTVGAKVVVASREEAVDPALLRQRLEQSGATLMQATPATWRLLLSSGWRGGPGFRALCGGEALGPELAEALVERVGELWNMYGPTETTIWSACHRVPAASPGEAAPRERVPVGRPIANTRLYVLDGWGEPVPIGVTGELHIGGEGVALGYLGLPELSAERFVPDPFAPGPARMYRTGDLARFTPEGELELLGRNDHQLKLRGFRIEPGEIESLLRRHPDVADAAVVARETHPGERHLAAYVVPAGPRPAADELRAHLQRSLPDYMVPAVFAFLDALPLTPNRKLDRHALPPPQHAPDEARRYRPPRDGLEAVLARLWAEALRRDRVGILDSFIEMGGDSIQGALLMNRVQSLAGSAVPVVTILEAPTVASFASYLRERHPGAASRLLSLGRPPDEGQDTRESFEV